MTKEDFFKKNDDTFLPLGFKKVETDDPNFFYERSILSDEAKEEFDENFNEDDEPMLLVGNTGENKGICLYTGTHFIWIRVNHPEEAIEWANKIVVIEEN